MRQVVCLCVYVQETYTKGVCLCVHCKTERQHEGVRRRPAHVAAHARPRSGGDWYVGVLCGAALWALIFICIDAACVLRM